MTDLPAALRHRYPDAETFRFGDNAGLCGHLLDLVRSGRKVASCGALRDYPGGAGMPLVGRRDIALTWDGVPALVIETHEVVHCRFDAVTEAMALAEGEDATLDEWRASHRRYFDRNGGFSPDLAVVWERFALIETLEGAA